MSFSRAFYWVATETKAKVINPPHLFSIVLNRFWFLSKDPVQILNSNVKPGSSLEFQIQDLNLLRTIEMCMVGI